jgi:hypothetical protein
MRVTNEPGGTGPTGAFAELFRLQSDFQSRLAEETLRYLRRLQGAVVPAAPGTVVVPDADSEMRTAASPGASATLTLEIENLQRVHCMVSPQLTPLVSASGVTWFPSVENATASKLIAPNTVEPLPITFGVPAELPAGEYRGALVLQGFRSNSLAVVVTVGDAKAPETSMASGTAAKKTKAAAKKAAAKKTGAKKTGAKKTAAKKTGAKKATKRAKKGES